MKNQLSEETVQPIAERWLAAREWAEHLLSQMTPAEKIGQLNQVSVDVASPELIGRVEAGLIGSVINVVDPEQIARLRKAAVASRLGIPLLFGRDIVHGFEILGPIPLGLAATWNPELLRVFCALTAKAASMRGLNWTFAPMVDLSRDPRWGRIAEGFGEDPFLSASLARASVQGFQEDLDHVLLACPKHFVGYGASESGIDYNRTHFSDQDLFNLYLPAFEAAFNAGALTVMPSFSEINGQPGVSNQRMLRQILRERLGYTGLIVSDWAALAELTIHGVAEDGAQAAQLGLEAGVHIDMMSGLYETHLVDRSALDTSVMKLIDPLVLDVLTLKHAAGLLDAENNRGSLAGGGKREQQNKEALLTVATQLAEESCILLKNHGQILPWRDIDGSLAIIGPLANQSAEQIGTWSFDADLSQCETPLQAFEAHWGGSVTFCAGLDYSRARDAGGIEDAVKLAASSDKTLLVLGEEAVLSGEAHCRSELDLPGDQTKLLKAVAKAARSLVVVVMAGRPLQLTEILGDVDALLFCFHPGSQSGPAIRNILVGDTNPSGRLPVSFPRSVGQIPIYYRRGSTGRPPVGDEVQFIDDIPVGAKQYSTGNTAYHLDVEPSPLFPFGYGKSYSEFRYQNLSAEVIGLGDDLVVWVQVEIQNVSQRAGRETIQLYMRDPVARVARPVRELVAYKKIELQAGETKGIEFTLGLADLSYHDGAERFVEPGLFQFYVGGDSEASLSVEIRLTPEQLASSGL